MDEVSPPFLGEFEVALQDLSEKSYLLISGPILRISWYADSTL